MQIAHAVAADGQGHVALTLAPEELGQVRLELRPGANGLAIQIAADRPDTLDLIRRHLDELGRELRALGHPQVAFSFADESGGQRREPQWAAAEKAAAAVPVETDAPRPPRRGAAAGGLDIRL